MSVRNRWRVSIGAVRRLRCLWPRPLLRERVPPLPEIRDAADEIVGGNSQAALVALAEHALHQSLSILLPQPPRVPESLGIASLEEDLLGRSDDPGAITEERAREGLGLPAMAVE